MRCSTLLLNDPSSLRASLISVGDKISFHVVEDITKPHAFDDAARNVDVIAHVASPFHVCIL